MAERLQSSLDSLMMDTYGSYVLRTMLQVLGGVRVPDEVSRSKLSMQHQKNGNVCSVIYRKKMFD